MTASVRFCLVLHNHQPIGNFDHVFQQAYEDSYLPFLEVFEPYSDLQISLHTSGPLMEWLDRHHPEYLDRLAALVSAGRVEIVGGAFFEPILTMIPSRDRIGQIRRYTDWLQQRLGGPVRGMWIPERVWEQNLASDIANAGIEYTLLDDFHFRNAGLTNEQLNSYYITEDDGQTLAVFPGSERLRYLIPFQDPQQTIDHLGQISQQQPGAVVVFGDDGEKFGTWPETKKHVYEDGWLSRFFDALSANKHWIKAATLGDCFDSAAPQGSIFLPDASYREMTEWALPVDQLEQYEDITHEMEHDGRWPRLQQFVRAGLWRNFKVKYPESNEMYSRMMAVSQRLDALRQAGTSDSELDDATLALYRGQCNCSYWHGAFGGIYLPHLRNAVYQQLIRAENLLDKMERQEAWVEATVNDYDFDARQEVRLANDKLLALIAPARGGVLYELDVRGIEHNLLATLARRKEAYHRRVLAGVNGQQGEVSSIHDRVVFKQEGLDQKVHYDAYPRKSLIDHFFASDVSLEQLQRSEAVELGDFIGAHYEAKLRRNPDRIQVQLTRNGNVGSNEVRITKAITAEAGSTALEVAYLLEGLPTDEPVHFGVEFNFAGLPAGADDRYFYGHERQGLGQLGTRLQLEDQRTLGLVDEWLGIDVELNADRATNFWTFPIETVSQSEGGFELVHQSVVVIPHWNIETADGRWAVTFHMQLDTALAERRAQNAELVAP